MKLRPLIYILIDEKMLETHIGECLQWQGKECYGKGFAEAATDGGLSESTPH